MGRPDGEAGKPSLLTLTREKAIRLLGARLEAPGQLGLRKYQTPVMHDWLKSLQKGETAGYIELPTGAGKTVVAAKFAELGLNTIVVSPTGEILDKTKQTIEKHTEGITVSNFDGRLKDLTGNVINTTLPSLETISQIPAVAEGVELVIVDETHFGTLGRKRYELWRKFPNALFVGLTATPDFGDLDELERKGLVDPKERWTGMFKNRIHRLRREEAQKEGALTPLDIHMVTTNSVVGNVHITKGEYDQREIDKMLNTEARNIQAIAMVTGVDHIPPSVRMTPEKREQLRDLHEKIKDKRTAIFGLNIKHVEDLAQRLRDLGVRAAAVHGKLSRQDQTTLLKLYEQGQIQVILGVDLLSIGWDSPATEVGLFMRPRLLDTAVIQEVGRLLRISEETGKERAIAIQLVDHFEDASEQPVLIPEVVDPNYILKGKKGRIAAKKRKDDQPEETDERESTITISGMDIEAIEELVTEANIRRELNAATSLTEVNDIIDDVITRARSETYGQSLVGFYKKTAAILPPRLNQDVQRLVLEQIKSDDEDVRRMAQKSFLFLNLKSLLTAVRPLLSNDEAANEDIIATASMQLLARAHKFLPDSSSPITVQINPFLKSGEVLAVAADQAHVPSSWIKGKDIGMVIDVVDAAISARRELSNELLTPDEVESVVAELVKQTGYEKDVLRDVVIYRDTREPHREDAILDNHTPEHIRISNAVNIALTQLSATEASILELRHGVGTEDGKPQTLAEVASEYGVSPTNIAMKERRALSKLRHHTRRRKIYDALE